MTMSSYVFPCPDPLNSSQSSQSTGPPLSRRRLRSRTVSVSSSLSRITLDFVNADATLPTLHPLADTAHGSFTPTASARAALQYLGARNSTPRSFKPIHRSRPMFEWPDDNDSPLSSGPPSPIIPVNRTISPSFIPSRLSSASTSSSTLIGQFQQGHQRTKSDEPILAKLERKSKLLSQRVACSTCGKQGSGYPKCGSCNAMWCSRECRLAGASGKHVCSHKKPVR